MNPRMCDCDRCGLVVRAEDAEATVRENEELLKWYRGGLLTIESTEAENARLRAELAEQRRELKATQAGWLIEINKVARVQELCDERDESARSVYTASWVFVSDVLSALEGNQP